MKATFILLSFLKRHLRYYSVFAMVMVAQSLSAHEKNSKVITYPAPPGLQTSPDLKVTADNIPIWVERAGSRLEKFNHDLGLYGGRKLEDMDVAAFAFTGKTNLVITANQNIQKLIIRPKSLNIKADVKDNKISISLDSPVKLYIEINDLPHLAVFADPPEKDPVTGPDKGITFFGPGAHNPGTINLNSNQTIYIAAGAIVYADITGQDISNITIRGRGMLQGTIKVTGATNLHVSDIFIKNNSGWTNTLTDCRNSSYRNVKVFSFEDIYGLDGINPLSCKNFTVDNCFMRCRDDCVAIKSPDYKSSVDSVYVTNCTMVGWSCADGVTIGFELNGGPIRNIVVRNCDILYARGGGRTEGHSGFSIVCDGPATVENVLFEDIRIEEQVEFKNLELIVTHGTYYGEDPPGHIKNIRMKNISWENPAKPFILSGFSPENLVEDIIFENCSVGGKSLRSISDADFRINEFTRDIVFTTSDAAIEFLIRGDDIGSSHAANVACIESYRNGIMKSVELMVPGPWFPEAVKMLKDNPGLDIGVHLVVTSEWSNIKWRPLTCCPSLVDKDGYFFPMIWPNPNFPKGSSLKEADWKIDEIEKEFRAQIEMAKKYLPWISHVNCHMGCEGCDPQIEDVVKKLAREYGLDIDPEHEGFRYQSLWDRKDTTSGQRIAATVKTLNNLKPGKYYFIEHPGINTAEMQAIWHTGYENVASDRDAVTKVYTSSEVKEAIEKKGIRLMSYKDIKN